MQCINDATKWWIMIERPTLNANILAYYHTNVSKYYCHHIQTGKKKIEDKK